MKRGHLVLAWLAAVLAAALVAALVPPFQSPDEHSHIMRAYMLSRGRLALQTPPGGSSGGPIDTELLLFMRPYLQKVVTGRAKHLEGEERRATHAMRWSGKELFFPIPGTGYYLPVIYAPHAAGLAIGQALDLTIIQSLRLARLLCIAAGIALLAAAWRVLRPPPLAVALLLLPMTMFQLLSPTLDGITTCIAVLALSLAMRRATDPAPPPRWQAWALPVCLLLLATTRVHLFPLVLLPFWFGWRERSWREAAVGAVVLVAALAWTAYALTHTVDQRVVREFSTRQVLGFYALRPQEFLRLVWVSCTDATLGPQYAKSFVGILGWLDTELAQYWYPVLWAALGAFAVLSLALARPRVAGSTRLVLAGLSIASAALVFFALLVTWSPHPAKLIEGVQGRYFIVPALGLAYAAARPAGAPRPPRWPWALLAVYAAAALYALIGALLARYH
jgi:uncharacterized membrane protein